MKKNAILYTIVALIILKTIFNKYVDLNNPNFITYCYFIALGLLSFILFKNYQPKNKWFWVYMAVYIIIVILISVYELF